MSRSPPRRRGRRSSIGIMAVREATLRATIARQKEQIAHLREKLTEQAARARLARHHDQITRHAKRIPNTLFPTHPTPHRDPPVNPDHD